MVPRGRYAHFSPIIQPESHDKGKEKASNNSLPNDQGSGRDGQAFALPPSAGAGGFHGTATPIIKHFLKSLPDASVDEKESVPTSLGEAAAIGRQSMSSESNKVPKLHNPQYYGVLDDSESSSDEEVAEEEEIPMGPPRYKMKFTANTGGLNNDLDKEIEPEAAPRIEEENTFKGIGPNKVTRIVRKTKRRREKRLSKAAAFDTDDQATDNQISHSNKLLRKRVKALPPMKKLRRSLEIPVLKLLATSILY